MQDNQQPIPYLDFAKKVKEKYPEYAEIDDLILSQKMVEKFPEYKGIVVFDDVKKKDAPASTQPAKTLPAGVSPDLKAGSQSLSQSPLDPFQPQLKNERLNYGDIEEVIVAAKKADDRLNNLKKMPTASAGTGGAGMVVSNRDIEIAKAERDAAMAKKNSIIKEYGKDIDKPAQLIIDQKKIDAYFNGDVFNAPKARKFVEEYTSKYGGGSYLQEMMLAKIKTRLQEEKDKPLLESFLKKELKSRGVDETKYGRELYSRLTAKPVADAEQISNEAKVKSEQLAGVAKSKAESAISKFTAYTEDLNKQIESGIITPDQAKSMYNAERSKTESFIKSINDSYTRSVRDINVNLRRKYGRIQDEVKAIEKSITPQMIDASIPAEDRKKIQEAYTAAANNLYKIKNEKKKAIDQSIIGAGPIANIFGKSLVSGFTRSLASFGDYMLKEGVSNSFTKWLSDLSTVSEKTSSAEYDWKEPHFKLLKLVGESTGGSLPFMVPAIALSAVPGAQPLAAAAVGGLINARAESMTEGGQTFRESLEKGEDAAVAAQKADKIDQENMKNIPLYMIGSLGDFLLLGKGGVAKKIGGTLFELGEEMPLSVRQEYERAKLDGYNKGISTFVKENPDILTDTFFATIGMSSIMSGTSKAFASITSKAPAPISQHIQDIVSKSGASTAKLVIEKMFENGVIDESAKNKFMADVDRITVTADKLSDVGITGDKSKLLIALADKEKELKQQVESEQDSAVKNVLQGQLKSVQEDIKGVSEDTVPFISFTLPGGNNMTRVMTVNEFNALPQDQKDDAIKAADKISVIGDDTLQSQLNESKKVLGNMPMPDGAYSNELSNTESGMAVDQTGQLINKKQQIKEKFGFGDEAFAEETYTPEEDAADREALPESEFKTEEELINFLETGEYAMLTGQNPDAVPLSKEANRTLNQKATEWLAARGLKPTPLFGKYGNSERSFFVPNMTKEQSIEFAKEFQQDSVAHSSGLVYKDGSFNPRNGKPTVEQLFDKGEDFFSSINIGGKKVDFRVPYDLDTKMPAEKKKTIADEINEEVLGKKPATIDAALSTAVDTASKSLEKAGIKFSIIDSSTDQSGAARGNQAIFKSDTGDIIIDKSKLQNDIEAGLVVWHEAAHPVMNILRNTDKPLYDAVVSGLQEAANKNKGIADALGWAQENYSGEATQNDEAIVETIGRINAGVIDIESLDTGLRQKLIDFVNAIAKALGIDPILSNTDLAQFKKTVSEVADALKTGRDVAGIVGEGNTKEFSVLQDQLRVSAADIAKRTEDKTIEGKSQPSMVLTGKRAGVEVDLYSGPASIEGLREHKPGMYISRAEDLAKSDLVQGKTRAYSSSASQEQKLKWADNVFAKAKETVVSNLLFLFDAIPSEIREISKLWYDGANIIAQELSAKYNTTLEQASAVIATQSPQKPWYDNVHLAHFIMDFYATKKDTKFTQEMYDYYALKSGPTKVNPKGYPKQIEYLPTLKTAIGKSFSELSNYDKSVMIRADFDNNYERRAPLRIPTGVIVGRVSSMSSFSGYDTIAKAVSILEDGSDSNISSNLGNAYKVRNFYNNIATPKMDGEVTIDTHAMAAAYMLPLGSSSPEVKFDEGTYSFFADAYRDAAAQRGVLAREMQSIVWEGVRSVFPAADKNEANKAKAREIWKNYKNGSLPLSDVQNQIKANGKELSITDWSRFTDRILEEDGQSGYLEELPLSSRNQSTSGFGDGGTDSRGLPAVGEGSVQSSAGNRNLITEAKQKKLTDDKKGNYVFFHRTAGKLNKIDPKKFGSNTATGRDERPGVGISMFYTDNRTGEPGVPSNFIYAVRVPKEKVYPINEDPLNLYDEAKAMFEKDYPGQAFDANKQVGYITKVANEKGFEMTVVDWNIKGKKAVRAQTTQAVKPELYKSEEFKDGSLREVYNPELEKLKPGIQASAGGRDIIADDYLRITKESDLSSGKDSMGGVWISADFGDNGGMTWEIPVSQIEAGNKNNPEYVIVQSIDRNKTTGIAAKDGSKGEGAKAIASLFNKYPSLNEIGYDDYAGGFWQRIGGSEDVLKREDFFNYYNSKSNKGQASAGNRLAPNGKPSNLNEKQWNQVRTPEFKAWFGDWENDPKNASKVVDENGEPMVVYHGSPAEDIEIFDRNLSTKQSSGLKEIGVYFTTNKKLADVYSSKEYLNKDLSDFEKGKIYEVFLNLRDVKEFDAKGESGIRAWDNLEVDAGYKIATNRDAMDFLANGKFNVPKVDGIIAKNLADVDVYTNDPIARKKISEELSGTVFLVFDDNKNAIKSATDNSGAFSTTDNRIQASAGNRTAADFGESADPKTRITLEDLGVYPGMTSQELLDNLLQFGGTFDPLLKAIAKKKNLGELKIADMTEITDDPSEAAGGFLSKFVKDVDDRFKGKLYINTQSDNYDFSTKNQYYTLTHELMHWVTLDSLDTPVDSPAYDKLKSIYDVLLKNADTTPGFGTFETYGLSNFNEFMAELFISAKFRDYVKDVMGTNEDLRSLNNESKDLITLLVDYLKGLYAKIFGETGPIDENSPLIDQATKVAKDMFFGDNVQASLGKRKLEQDQDFKLAAYVMRKKSEGTPIAEIAMGIMSAIPGMTVQEVNDLVSDPEQYIRTKFKYLSPALLENLISRAGVKNIYKKSTTEADPAFDSLEVDESMIEVQGKKNKIKEKIREVKSKYFDAAKGMPNWVLALKDITKGVANLEVRKAIDISKDLKKAAEAIGFTDWDAFSAAMKSLSQPAVAQNLATGIQPWYANIAASRKQLSNPPAVQPAEILALPEEIRPFVFQMRGAIDGLTKDLIASGFVTPEQAQTLEDNIGQYTNRAYRIFNEKGYEASEEDIRGAIKFLADQYVKQLATEKAGMLTLDEIKREAIEMANKDVKTILDKDVNPYFKRGDSRDTGILKERKDIPAPIRKLMGEYTDPATVFVMTVAKQAALKSASQYLTGLRNTGMGSIFFEKNDPSRPASHSVEIATDGSESKNPLGGLFTTPEIAESLNAIPETVNDLTNAWMKVVGAVRWSKTVGSVVTQVKNFLSNIGFAVMNGLVFSGENGQALKGAGQYWSGEVRGKELTELAQKAMSLGLVNQSVGMSELREMLGSGDVHDIAVELAVTGKSGKAKNWIGKTIGGLNKAYQLSDDFWKVYAYMNERQNVAKAMFGTRYESLTTEQQASVDIESSERVKNTWPTYDRVWEGAKYVSQRAPIFGNFVSFQAESVRVLGNTMKLALRDIKSDNPEFQAMGYKRLAGMITYVTLRSAITYAAAHAAGVGVAGLLGLGDDEEEKIKEEGIKNALPGFMRTSDLLVIPKKEKGQFTVFDLSSLDPYGVMFKSLNALTEGREGIVGDKMEPGVAAAMAEFMSGFLEPEMTFKTMMSIANNTNEKTGGKIFMEDDSRSQALLKAGKYAADQLKPSTIGFIQRLMGDNKIAEVSAVVGARPYEVDLTRSFGRIISTNGKNFEDIIREYNRVKYDPKATKEEKKAAEKEAEESMAYYAAKMNTIYNQFLMLGADPKVLDQMIVDKRPVRVTGWNKSIKKAVRTGKIESEKFLK